MKDNIFGSPNISPAAFVFNEDGSVIGDVTVDRDVIIAPGASIRADKAGPFYIGKGTNIQDGVIFHGLLNEYKEVGGEEFSIWIGSHCSIAHRALIHGPARIDKKTFIGFDAIVHKSIVGRNSFIDFKAVIKNSTLGHDCHVGIGAIVANVIIADGKYIEDNQVVKKQDIADNLPDVPIEIAKIDQEFNKEVVDLNKQLVELHRVRRKNGE